ncbi:serine protease snk-like [Epargyreus clarus]|uniref:serine protease snk-like n=1 Tax=Epargyreus clarus TaxID=520877 RepID=UPI003C2D555C
MRDCPSAINKLKTFDEYPKTCSFVRDEPVVCCRKKDITTTTPMTTVNECPPVSPTKTEVKTGRKARDKCIEYQEQFVYSCSKETGYTRVDNCWSDNHINIVEGKDTFKGEFPHMALLAYTPTPNEISFDCGGTIISDKYILTAAHCSSTANLGKVKYALIGALNKTNYTANQLHKIKNIIPHPRYRSPKKYDDIALLELETPLKLDPYTVPACLDISGLDDVEAIATGWGQTTYRGNTSDVLLKVKIEKIEEEKCSNIYLTNRNYANGIDSRTQLCFGSRDSSKDTCGGDSGGPLQVKDKKIKCMYTVIGVTSFGQHCGVAGEPAIYTKVSPYVEWIESVVWPA